MHVLEPEFVEYLLEYSWKPFENIRGNRSMVMFPCVNDDRASEIPFSSIDAILAWYREQFAYFQHGNFGSLKHVSKQAPLETCFEAIIARIEEHQQFKSRVSLGLTKVLQRLCQQDDQLTELQQIRACEADVASSGAFPCNRLVHKLKGEVLHTNMFRNEMTCTEFLRIASIVRARIPHVNEAEQPSLMLCDDPSKLHLDRDPAQLRSEELLFGPDSDDELDESGGNNLEMIESSEEDAHLDGEDGDAVDVVVPKKSLKVKKKPTKN